VLRASDATRARGAAARCSPARSGFRLARQLLQPHRRHRRLRSPWSPGPRAGRSRRGRGGGGRPGPSVARGPLLLGLVGGRAPARARARAPAASASQVLHAHVPAARLRAARQRAAVSGSLAARQRVARCSAAPSCSVASPGDGPALLPPRRRRRRAPKRGKAPSLEETRPLRRLATHSAAPGVPGGSQSPGARAAECRAHPSESAGGGPGAVTAAVVTARPRNNSRQPGRGGPPGAGRVAGK
jgi:hypothetical protein